MKRHIRLFQSCVLLRGAAWGAPDLVHLSHPLTPASKSQSQTIVGTAHDGA